VGDRQPGTSAGNLFLSAIMPGLMLSGLYLVYIVLVAIFKPGIAPKLPPGYGPQTYAEFWYALLSSSSLQNSTAY